MTWRILLSLPIWLAYTALEVILDVVGLFVILPLSLLRAWGSRPSRVYGREFPKPQLLHAWWGGWLTWLWGNEEDGVTGPIWWAVRHRDWPMWRIAYVWSALRNPVNNLRFVPGINPVIDPKRIQWHTGGGRTWLVEYTWQGVYSGLLIVFPSRGGTFRFWWGWKLRPVDVQGVSDNDMRKPRCGFAIQLKRFS